MIRQLLVLKCFYRRGRARREHIHLKQSLKDLTTTQAIQKQVGEHRQIFETDMPSQTLTQTLKKQNPKLDQRFKVDREVLQKKIRKRVGQELKIERIIPAQEGQQFQTLQSKSHIYDQRGQIQFEEKFRKQLFKKKETNRMIEKEKNDYRNYLEQPKNPQFLKYKQNMDRLKNSRINSMMNFTKNNQQLRLLIDSGYIDHPQNIDILISKINEPQQLEVHHAINLNPQLEAHQSIHKDVALQTSSNHNQPSQRRQQTSSHPLEAYPLSQTKLSTTAKDPKKISPQFKHMHSKMMQNINGPEQLRNPQMLQQFFQNLQINTKLEKQKAKQDLELIKEIKQFQTTTFQSRYNAINFRFKGQVDFSWMKQSQLLSYIKTQRNPDTQPEGLLTMYMQQKSLQNRFNQPIITPTVMSRIYSVCSLYNFPETDQNNRINMLNDKKYVDLEKNLFKNVHQLNDYSFADAVFAYCKNHKAQQGLLRPKMNQKIVEVMWRELNDRVDSISQEDLGLVLRSLINTPILNNQTFQWRPLVSSLSQRLPLMEKDYEFESVMSFLSLVPTSEQSIETVRENMGKFKTYKWESRETLESFMQCASFLMRFKSHHSPMRQHKMIQQLKYLFASKHEEIMSILDQLSINKMPQLLSIIYLFDKSKQMDAKYEIQIPNKLINKCKKEIVDNIKMQKELINKYTVGNTAMSMALIDYCKSLSREVQGRDNQLPVLQHSITLSLFSFRAIPFNSINYFTYHELTKLVNSQIRYLPVKAIAQTLFAASLVRYKNEGIYEEIMSRTVQKIYYEMKEMGESQASTHLKYNKQYIMLVCSFHHCRMVNQYFYHFMGYLKENGVGSMVKVEPNLLLRFFETVASLSFTTDPKYEEDYTITRHFVRVFDICFEENFKNCLSVLRKQQLLVLQYVSSLFQFFKAKQHLSNPEKNRKSNSETFTKRVQQINQHISKHQSKLTHEEKYLQSITRLLKKMIQYLQLTNPNQIQIHSLFDQQFISAQINHYKFSINTIMDQEQQIGSQFKYENIFQNVKKKIISQNPQLTIEPKTWRIQNPSNKEVFFLTTYEHLFAKYQDETTSVRLFGLWKVYFQLYALKDWKFRFICTFLQG